LEIAMTEVDWLASNNLAQMLAFLDGKASARKLRLFACACCRRAFHLSSLTEWVRQAVETGERYADGLASDRELREAHSTLLWRNPDQPAERMEEALLTVAAMATTDPRSETLQARLLNGAHNVLSAVTQAYLSQPLYWTVERQYVYADESLNHRVEQEKGTQANMLRDLIGPLPFHQVSVEPTWIAWRDGTIRTIVETIDQERRFEVMPIFADTLEEAGCTSQHILEHCRRNEMHFKGCWVVDLLLGKV
jgi:hypothetical protein